MVSIVCKNCVTYLWDHIFSGKRLLVGSFEVFLLQGPVCCMSLKSHKLKYMWTGCDVKWQLMPFEQLITLLTLITLSCKSNASRLSTCCWSRLKSLVSSLARHMMLESPAPPPPVLIDEKGVPESCIMPGLPMVSWNTGCRADI